MIFKNTLEFTLQIQRCIFDLQGTEVYAKPLDQRFSGVPTRVGRQSPAPDWDWSRIRV